jgi:hypothetical protein
MIQKLIQKFGSVTNRDFPQPESAKRPDEAGALLVLVSAHIRKLSA